MRMHDEVVWFGFWSVTEKTERVEVEEGRREEKKSL